MVIKLAGLTGRQASIQNLAAVKPIYAVLLLCLLFVAVVAGRVFNLVQPLPAEANTQQIPTPSVQKAPFNINGLIALHAFGEKKAVVRVQVQQQPESLPKTRLNLVLKGAFTHEEEGQSSALVAESKRGKSKRYYVNDTLPGGAKLHAVYPNSITLERAGRLETLDFPRNSQPTQQVANRQRYIPPKATAQNRSAVNQAPSVQSRLAQLRELGQQQAEEEIADFD